MSETPFLQPEDSGIVTPRLRLVPDPQSGRDGNSASLGVDRVPLSIVVPAFNEAQRLPKLFSAILAEIDMDETEIIIVDDGSSDETSTVAERFVSSLPHGKVIQLAVNGGKGHAIRQGVARSSGDIVVFMDADASTDMRSLKPIVESLESFDLVIGSRSHADAQVHRAHRYRAYMGGLFNAVVRYSTGLPFRDTQCGFKAFRGGVARLLFSISTVDGFAFDVEILRLADGLGFSSAEKPVLWTHQSGSKIRHFSDPVRMLRDILRVRFRKPKGSVSLVRIDEADARLALDLMRPMCFPLILSEGDGFLEVFMGHEQEAVRQSILASLSAMDIGYQEIVISVSSVLDQSRRLFVQSPA